MIANSQLLKQRTLVNILFQIWHQNHHHCLDNIIWYIPINQSIHNCVYIMLLTIWYSPYILGFSKHKNKLSLNNRQFNNDTSVGNDANKMLVKWQVYHDVNMMNESGSISDAIKFTNYQNNTLLRLSLTKWKTIIFIFHEFWRVQ